MKSILVHIEPDEGQNARLQAAFDLARAFGGHLACLQVTPYAAYALGVGGTLALVLQSWTAMRRAEARRERSRDQ